MRILVVLLALYLGTTASARDLRPVIAREARLCADAWQRGDCTTIVAYLPARVVQKTGGRAAVLAELQEQFAEARSLGAEELKITPGLPGAPKPVGAWLTSMIPVTGTVRGGPLQLTQQTHVLALSADQGRHWSFLLLYQVTQAQLLAWFPEFRGRITIPPTTLAKPELAY